MKRSSDFLLQNVAGTIVVVPVGAATAKFPGMMRLNETGAYLWELLAQEQTMDTLIQALMAEYEIDEATAQQDVGAFLEKLLSTGAVEDKL